MKKALVIAVIIVSCPWAVAGPTIAIEAETIDFGTIGTQDTASAPFTIRNAGDEPLVIERVASSCPCASIVTKKQPVTIPPGTEIEFEARYEPDGRIGERFATLAIHTNDPERPVTIMETRVFVQTPVVTLPPETYAWGYAARGHDMADPWTVTPGYPEADIELGNISVASPYITVSARKIRRNGRPAIEARFHVEPNAPIGGIETHVEAEVRVDGEPITVRRPMRGGILGDVLITPSAINSPRSVRDRNEYISEVTVRASVDGDPAPKVVAAFGDGPIKTEIVNDETGQAHTVKIYTHDNAPAGPQAALVYIITESNDQPVVRVPVFFRMAEHIVSEPRIVHLTSERMGVDVQVLDSSGQAVEIDGVAVEGTAMKAEKLSELGAVRVSLTKSGVKTREAGMLVVHTGLANAKPLYIPVIIGP